VDTSRNITSAGDSTPPCVLSHLSLQIQSIPIWNTNYLF